VAQGKGPDARVRDAMTADVKYCFEDEDLDDVVRSMGEQKVRRLPVMSREKRLVGIVSLGDVAVYADSNGFRISLWSSELLRMNEQRRLAFHANAYMEPTRHHLHYARKKLPRLESYQSQELHPNPAKPRT
jgi:CBS-domain-containing membrane protein